MAQTHDLSSRFVLPDNAAWLANLAALWTVDPRLAEQLESLHPAPSYPLQASKAGPPTVYVARTGGPGVLLHSRYDPIAEAERLIESTDPAKNLVFYVFGFGLGYHAQRLFERAATDAVICVFEPDLLLLRTAFEQRDFSALIESRRVLFFTRAEKADLLTRLMPHAVLVSVGAENVVHPPSQALNPEFHRQMQTWVGEFASFMRTSLNTVVLNSRRTAENIAANLAWYVASPGIGRLRNRHRGKPAVIVSAGPSLRKNKHLLAGLKDRAVIIAVQTTLRPLLEMGVEPHYVTSLDYHEICTRFFENLPDSLGTELVAEPKANHAIFGMYPGPVTVLGNAFAESLLREMRLGRPELRAGATVAHLAFYLAEHLGADPVIFVGQDLGFGDGLCYAPGTSYEDVWRPELGRFCSVEMKQWEQIVRERFILRRIPDWQGRPMYTEERLFTYLQQFERDFAETRTRVIDATEGGAAKRGATPMTLADAAGQLCDRPLDPAGEAHPGLDWSRVAECIDCLERRRDEARQIEQISRQTLPLLEEIRDHQSEIARVNRAIGQIDGLRAKMNALGATYDLVLELTQASQLKRFESDRRISAERLGGTDKQRRQVERDVENVRGVMNAAADFQRLMDDVVTLFSSKLSTHFRAAA